MTVQSKTRIAKATQSKPVKRLVALVLITLPTLTIAETVPKRINIPLPSLKTKPAKSAATLQPLYYYQVYGIQSEQYPATWEIIEEYQNITVQNHGGNYINVAVIQLGFGNSNAPTIGAYKGSNYANDNLCGTTKATIHYCKSGEVVTGFIRYFKFRGAQSGKFYGSVYSLSTPVKTLYDEINIR